LLTHSFASDYLQPIDNSMYHEHYETVNWAHSFIFMFSARLTD